MNTQTCGFCSGVYALPDNIDDKTNGACPHCGKAIYILSGLSKKRELLVTTLNPQSESRGDFSDLETTQKRKEYKVLSQKDKWFSGKFDPSLLEKALNEYAKHGWHVVSCASADINSIMGANRQEMVIILERDV